MSRIMRQLGVLAILASFLSACAAPKGVEFYDPAEPLNRQTHELNKVIDRTLYDPAGQAYGFIFTDGMSQVLDNFTDNLAKPATIANQLLQLKIGQALTNTMRFLVNTTFGLGGLADPADDMGIPDTQSDFGATLHRYGVGEGAFVELPFFGGSTVRDTVGLAVDLAMDPLRLAAPHKYRYAITGTQVVQYAGDRHEFDSFIDELLYNSEDSYLSQRLFYLQNRRTELGGGKVQAADIEDPFADDF
ncbi:MAG: VacJ family lipoprotein [Pseudomonadota bacterium]